MISFARFRSATTLVLCLVASCIVVSARAAIAADAVDAPEAAVAESESAMKPYRQRIAGTDVSFEMVPIPGGEFLMGSPADEANGADDERPQHKVRIAPFWMGKHEVTWDEYDVWNFDLDIQRRMLVGAESSDLDKLADAVTRPTAPYTDMTFGMGHDGYPAICMTHLAAQVYCQWLSAKTGHFYRLPTEAEWEYACRAGTTGAYSFGDGPGKLDDYAWHYDNSGEKYQKVGLKKPNPWGLYDMHGNVAEWCLDQHDPGFYQLCGKNGASLNPLCVATKEYPHVARGGSWFDDADRLRSAAREKSDESWKVQDPQLPKSVWYHTDADFVGFRIVRPLVPPTAEERAKLKLDPVIPQHARTKTNAK
ncbi:MAG: SUMF1/EgtB/PvdO family nonheme iron enzyme [Planctomycetales bacterium]